MNRLIRSDIAYLVLAVITSLSFSSAGFASEIVHTQTFKDSLKINTDPLNVRKFGNLRDKYQGDDFIYDSEANHSGWWTRFKKWLSDFLKDLFDLSTDAQASDLTDIALQIFYVVIFLLVVLFIVKAIVNKEGTWVFGKSSGRSIIPVTDVENNVHATDFNTLINNAERNGNFRLAVRYYYLWLLKTLSEAEIIIYDVEKTNSDYYYEIKKEHLKKQYAYTSYLYNYIWYGEFEIDRNQFEKAKRAFAQFVNSIKT